MQGDIEQYTLRWLKLFVLAGAVTWLFGACAQGGRVPMGNHYPPATREQVQILFQAPNWPSEQIGIVTSQGAQLANDATVYEELRSQAAKLGADAVLIVSAGPRQYAFFPGFANYNAYGSGNLYGNRQGIYGNAQYQATGVAVGPASFVGLNIQGIALKRLAAQTPKR